MLVPPFLCCICCHAVYFFDCRDALECLQVAVLTHRDHSLLYCLALNLGARRAGNDEILNLLRYVHDLVEAGATTVTMGRLRRITTLD